MECEGGWKTLQDSVLSSPTSATTLLDMPSEEQRESSLTAFALVPDVSALAYTNGFGPFCGLRVRHRAKDRCPFCPSLSNRSTSPYGVHGWLDGSG